MTKPTLVTFNQLAPLIIQQYESYLPNAFDESFTILQKVNKIIQQLNKIGEISNELVEKWNEVIEWVTGEGITETIQTQLDEMVLDGSFDTIINTTIFNRLNDAIGVNLSDYPRLVGENDDNGRFNRAITQAKILKGKVVVPVGTYIITDTIQVTNGEFYGCMIEGINSEGVTINAQLASSTKPLFSFKGGSGAFTNIGLKNLTLKSLNKHIGVAIYLDGQCFGIFEKIHMRDFNYGLWLHNNSPGNFTEINTFRDIDIQDCKEHIRMERGGGDDSLHGNVFDNVHLNILANQIGLNHVSGYWYNGRFNILAWSHDSSAVYIKANGNTEKTIGVFTYEGNGKLQGNQRFWFEGFLTGISVLTDESTRVGTGIDEHQTVFKCNNYETPQNYGTSGMSARIGTLFSSYDSPLGYMMRLIKNNVDSMLINVFNGSGENGLYIGSTGFQQKRSQGVLGWFIDGFGSVIKSYQNFFKFVTNDGTEPLTISNNSVNTNVARNKKVRKIGANATAGNEEIILVDCGGGNVTLSLPFTDNGRVYEIKRFDGSVNTLTILPTGGAQIDWNANATLAGWGKIRIVFIDGQWWTI